MEKVVVKVVREGNVLLPKYETSGSAGMDVRANIEEPIKLLYQKDMKYRSDLEVDWQLNME